ncbi:MAG: hypothetical protein FWD63_05035 [Propionibacteriaceae bacterium]|nr:hypothetical protein [Propionibacteriaceae bacterium]
MRREAIARLEKAEPQPAAAKSAPDDADEVAALRAKLVASGHPVAWGEEVGRASSLEEAQEVLEARLARVNAKFDVPFAKLTDAAIGLADQGRETDRTTKKKLTEQAGLAPGSKIGVNFDTGEFVWFGNRGRVVCDNLQIVGVRSRSFGMWQWGWANDSVPKARMVASGKIRKYGERHGIEILTKDSCKCGADDQWPFCHLAVGLGLGSFISMAPNRDLEIYLVLDKPKIRPL